MKLERQRLDNKQADLKKISEPVKIDHDSKKKPRVSDSLLLDNFLIKKKEEPVR